MSTHPPGAVIVMAAEAPRHTDFWFALGALKEALPLGSGVLGMPGVEICRNLNVSVWTALDGGAAWVWIIGDDHLFEPDIVTRLLDHGKDIVVPNCLHRGATPRPVVFDAHPGPRFTQRDCDGAAGLIRVDGAGSAGMLVRRAVFEAVPQPWFEMGRLESDLHGEDLWFSHKARAAGFETYCDLETHLGHKTPVTLWPHRTEDGRWTVRYSFTNGHEMVETRG